MSLQRVSTLSLIGTVLSLDPAKPTFPQQWTANQIDDVAINQGGEVIDGNICCPHDAEQCKIQELHQTALFHFDFPNNRTRSGDVGVEGAIVSLFGTVGKELEVSANNTCKEYCPLPESLDPFSLDKDAKYLGSTTFQGKDADEWTWTEYIIPKLHLGKLQQTNFYVSKDSPPLPLQESDIIEPFGQHLGVQNQTWSQFKAGPPPDVAFAVHGIDKCPMSPNCNAQNRVAHRQRARDMKNLAFYKFPQYFVGQHHQPAGMATVV
jgi:hypothetical protein